MPQERGHMLVILPMHLRSPIAAGTVPTSFDAVSMDVSLATKPELTVFWSEVKVTVIAPPVDETGPGTAVPSKLPSSGALLDVPS